MDKQGKDHNRHEIIDFIGQLTEVERTYFQTFGTLAGYDKKDLKNSWMRYLPESKRYNTTPLENKNSQRKYQPEGFQKVRTAQGVKEHRYKIRRGGPLRA